MQRTHIKIACAIGRGIDERLERIEREPLPKRLIDLLDRLGEQTTSKAAPARPKGKVSGR